MRISLPASGVVATCVGVTCLVAVTGTASAAAAAAAAGPHRIAVTEKADFTTQDLGQKGLSVGDHLVYSSVLKRSGTKVGDGGGDCVLISGTTDESTLYQCVATYRFGEATLTLQGFFDAGSNAQQRWAITGGTGRYANAHGVGDFKALSADTFTDVFRFTS